MLNLDIMDHHHPLMLGVVGDSAAGKTTLVRGVVRLLARNGVTPVCLDDYNRYERAERNRLGLTAGDPTANDLPLMLEHLSALRNGGSIRKPVYDHRNGRFRAPELVVATELVIAYGMLTLSDPGLCELFDLSIYLDPSEDLRRLWRLNRDTTRRGYTSDEFTALEPARERDAARFIHVQRRLADLVFRTLSGDTGELRYALFARHTATLTILEPLVAQLIAAPLPGIRITPVMHDLDGRESDLIQIDAALPAESVTNLRQTLRWADMLPAEDDLARIGLIEGASGSAYSSGLAIVQQLIAYLLVARRR
ncbi:MAG: phosphoribulokinase [Oscillochloris sp.]|nr:phosphoribulokinase [Oscillochloris sp.]